MGDFPQADFWTAWLSVAQHIVTASDDSTARIWSIVGAQELAILRGHTDTVSNGALTADGERIVTASWDRTARVWSATTGKVLATLQGHSDAVKQRVKKSWAELTVETEKAADAK